MMTLSDIRRLAGRSQAQVAEAMGVKQARVSQIEQQYPDVVFTVLGRYMEALGARVQFAVAGAGVVQATAVEQDRSRAEGLEKRRGRTRRLNSTI